MITGVRGPVFSPTTPGYAQECEGANLRISHQPRLAVGALDTADVLASVAYAATAGEAVTVQATGHGAITPANGVLLNTARLNHVTLDADRLRARVGAGTRWAQVLEAVTPLGLAPLNGSSPLVGVAGYSLGGGVGPLSRKYGYAASSITSLQIVTADGVARWISPEVEPELFWGVRGGRDNLGIVTELEFELVTEPRLFGGGLFFTGAAAESAVTDYLQWTAYLPNEMTSSLLIGWFPPAPQIPEPLRGQFVAHIRIAHCGDAPSGARLVEPLRPAATIDTLGSMPYRQMGSIWNDPTAPASVAFRSGLLHSAPEAATLLGLVGPDARAPYLLEIRHLGGALAAAPERPSAIDYPDAKYLFFTVGRAGTDGPISIDDLAQAQSQLVAALRPWRTSNRLVSFSGPDDVDTAEASYRPATLTKLRSLVQHYNPDGLLGSGLPISPSPEPQP